MNYFIYFKIINYEIYCSKLVGLRCASPKEPTLIILSTEVHPSLNVTINSGPIISSPALILVSVLKVTLLITSIPKYGLLLESVKFKLSLINFNWSSFKVTPISHVFARASWAAKLSSACISFLSASVIIVCVSFKTDGLTFNETSFVVSSEEAEQLTIGNVIAKADPVIKVLINLF
ncbi:MAG: hypothetical protein ACRCUM_00910 [Mycoplasmoidaceae bacterium]